jgi:hypothetical protein
MFSFKLSSIAVLYAKVDSEIHAFTLTLMICLSLLDTLAQIKVQTEISYEDKKYFLETQQAGMSFSSRDWYIRRAFEVLLSLKV